MKTTRREIIKAVGAAALVPAARERSRKKLRGRRMNRVRRKSVSAFAADIDEAGMRQIKQIGVNYVLSGGPPIPWTEDVLRERINQFKAQGLTLINLMISRLSRKRFITDRDATKTSRKFANPFAPQAKSDCLSSNTISTRTALLKAITKSLGAQAQG